MKVRCRVKQTIFLGIDHEFTCVREISVIYIQTKLVTDQYQFQQDQFGGLFMRGRNI